MSQLMSFGFGMACAAIIALGTFIVMGDARPFRRNRQGPRYTEVSADRLGSIGTDELTYLAEQFHVLTVHMYNELCTRRTAELGTIQLEAMLRDDEGGP